MAPDLNDSDSTPNHTFCIVIPGTFHLPVVLIFLS